ncbi:hypothetical protein ACFX2G_028162 [Malus domestica]
MQGAHTGLVEENVQLKNEKVDHEVALASYQADFYKLVDLLDFSFEAAFGGAAESQAVQEGAAEEKLIEALAVGSGAATEGVVVEEEIRDFQLIELAAELVVSIGGR